MSNNDIVKKITIEDVLCNLWNKALATGAKVKDYDPDIECDKAKSEIIDIILSKLPEERSVILGLYGNYDNTVNVGFNQAIQQMKITIEEIK